MYYCKEYFDDSNEKKSNEENQMYKFILKTSKLLEIEQRYMRNFGFSGFANFLQKCKIFSEWAFFNFFALRSFPREIFYS